MTIVDNIDISHLLKARDVFGRLEAHASTEQGKMALIKAFEYSYELSWKTMKRALESQGILAGSPKETFRKAVQIGLIENPEVCFKFLEAQNLTVHTYIEECLDDILGKIKNFLQELDKLITRLKALK